jgi:hypothetical protein
VFGLDGDRRESNQIESLKSISFSNKNVFTRFRVKDFGEKKCGSGFRAVVASSRCATGAGTSIDLNVVDVVQPRRTGRVPQVGWYSHEATSADCLIPAVRHCELTSRTTGAQSSIESSCFFDLKPRFLSFVIGINLHMIRFGRIYFQKLAQSSRNEPIPPSQFSILLVLDLDHHAQRHADSVFKLETNRVSKPGQVLVGVSNASNRVYLQIHLKVGALIGDRWEEREYHDSGSSVWLTQIHKCIDNHRRPRAIHFTEDDDNAKSNNLSSEN